MLVGSICMNTSTTALRKAILEKKAGFHLAQHVRAAWME